MKCDILINTIGSSCSWTQFIYQMLSASDEKPNEDTCTIECIGILSFHYSAERLTEEITVKATPNVAPILIFKS